jgi:hypothetical protein
MNRRHFLFSTALLCAPRGFARETQNPDTKAPEKRKNGQASESERRIEKATMAAMAMQRLDWEQGILAQAMFEAGLREKVIQLT